MCNYIYKICAQKKQAGVFLFLTKYFDEIFVKLVKILNKNVCVNMLTRQILKKGQKLENILTKNLFIYFFGITRFYVKTLAICI